MNKEQYIKLLISKDYLNIVYEYCMEKGKKIDEIKNFMLFLFGRPFIKEYCVKYTIEYFDTKFEITYLTDKEGKLIKIF